ncbi:UbiD family decarboxylase [Acidobacteria bacterium AH-259-D05]|nr:UbiD family decarboxylase [Acidobacteria bacterium AH-259-D05]
MLDLQGFLKTYQKEHLRIRKPVKLDQVGALVAQAQETIVFENIEGHSGWQVVDQLFINRKAQARVLGCDPKEVVQTLSEVMHRGPKPLKEVSDAPCQKQIHTGDEVDLSLLPIIRHTEIDPYPYTTGFAVHRNPETGQLNQMYPRCGVLNRNEMVTSFVTTTANRFLSQNRAAGTKMPQAIVIGCHPAWELAGVYSHLHDDWWELQLFEAITGEVGEVTRCKTVDLLVPADASIVIEGNLSPTRTAQDGPSPGPTMLFTPGATQQPVFEVSAITMRKDPIYRNHMMTPFTDHQEMPRLFHEAILYDRLRAQGLEVHDLHMPQGGGALSVILQVNPAMEGQINDALLAVLGAPWMNCKMAIAVDPDIDIYDYRDIHYALATRVDPSKHVITIPNTRGSPFDPSAQPVPEAFPHTQETRFPSVVGKWGIDATKPVPYREAERKDFERAWPIGWKTVRLEDFLE